MVNECGRPGCQAGHIRLQRGAVGGGVRWVYVRQQNPGESAPPRPIRRSISGVGGGAVISRVARLLALAALALLPMWLVGGAVGQGIGVLTVTGAQASEGDALRFRVNLSPALTSDVVVELETRIDGRTGAAAATPDSDFPSSSARRLTIHAGSTGAWFSVPTVEDGLYEGDETFELRIADVAEGLAQIGAADRAIGTIVEDDPMPQVSLHQSAPGVFVDNAQGVDDAELTLEGGSASEPAEIVYRVYLSSPSGLDTTVPYTLSGTATADLDYTDPAVKQLVIPAGELSGVISITTLPDTLGEDHETLIVTLGAATNATVASGAGEATGRIFDDDQAKHIVLSLTPHRVPESVSTEMTYTLSASLGGGATADSAVLIESRVGGLLIVGGGHTATHGADFGLRDAVEGKIGLNITIPAGQNSGSNTFNGTITNDTLDEFDEAIAFGHDVNRVANTGELWGTHNGYSFFYPRLTIIDNDGAHVPTLSVADAAAVQEGNDASVTTDMHFAVSLSAASGKDVTVWYALGGTATAGDDYDTPPLSLTIEAGSTTGRVTLPVRGDRADEGSSETVVLTLLGADHADLVLGGTAASGLITDDDGPPTLSVAAAAADEGDAVTFTVSLSHVSGQDVTFNWSSGGDASGAHPATAGDDYTSVAGRTVVIPAGTQSVQVSVATIDDDVDEHAETFQIILSRPVNAALSADPTAVGTINTDATDPQPAISIADAADVAEGDDPAATADMVFPVTLSEASGKDVSVSFAVASDTATAGDDYVAPSSTTLTIPAGQTTGDIIVQITGDTEDELHEILTVTLSNPVNATLGEPNSAAGMIRDNEGTDKPWVYLLIKEDSIIEGESITVELRSTSVFKVDTEVNFYVWYKHHVASLGDVATDAWFVNPRNTGLQIATIPSGQSGVDVIIDTQADGANFDGDIWAAMLTPGLMQTEGFQNIGHPDRPLEPYVPEWESLQYGTGTPDIDRVQVRDGLDAGTLPELSISADAVNVVEGKSIEFTLAAHLAPAANLDVSVTVSQSGDVGAASGAQTVTIAGGSTEATLTISTTDDTVEESDGSVTATIDPGSGYTVSTNANAATVAVWDNDASTYEVTVSAGAAISEGSCARFTIRLHPAPSAPVDVHLEYSQQGQFLYYLPQDGEEPTATMGTSGAGIVCARTENDLVDEPDGSVTLTITDVGGRYTVSRTQGSATVTVTDNDEPPVHSIATVSGGAATVEGECADFTIKLDPAPAVPRLVWFEVTQQGHFRYGDKDGPWRSLTTVGQSGSDTLCVQSQQDDVDEPHGSFTLTIRPGSHYTVSATHGAATVAVRDDDDSLPSVSIKAGGEVIEGGTATFTLQAVPAPSTPLVVNVTAGTTGDFGYGALPSTVTIPTSGSATVSIATTDDQMDEADGYLTLTLDQGDGYNVWPLASSAAVLVSDDDGLPTVSVRSPFGASFPENTTCIWFQVKINPAPTNNLEVKLQRSQQGEYLSTSWPVRIGWVSAGSGTYSWCERIVNDNVDEPDGHIGIRLLSSDDFILAPNHSYVEVAIRDDDEPAKPEINISAASDATEGDAVTFTLTASPAPAADLAVSLTTATSGDFGYGALPTSVTIPTSGSATVSITTTDDQADEPDGSVTLTVNAGSDYTVGATSAKTVAVADDDDPAKPEVNISAAAVWRGPTGAARLTLREALGYALPTSGAPQERPLARVSMPQALELGYARSAWMLPAVLTTAEKRALDLIGDWPWLRPGHLAALLGVGRRRLTQLLARLDEPGLITRIVRAGAPRLALSDRGLAYLARRDRTSVGIARKRWSPEPRWPGDPFDWRNVSGIRSRQLLRNLEHAESVHWFNTLLAGQSREQSSRLVQLDPPHRASRYFRSHERMHSIQPDAYALLETSSGEQAFFLEWERRAVRPATMAARLAPYLRYYATGRPLEDHGLLPRVLVVFEDELAADHFLRIAAEAVARAEVPLPLLVTDRRRLQEHGPLGRAWRSIEHRAPRGLD